MSLLIASSLQNKTPASSLLNRENQRRSRKRRREFVEDLQRRVLEYEQGGIQATVEMQKAARAVAAENSALRTLLASRGVSEDEIKAFLSSQASFPRHSNQTLDGTTGNCLARPLSSIPASAPLRVDRSHTSSSFVSRKLQDSASSITPSIESVGECHRQQNIPNERPRRGLLSNMSSTSSRESGIDDIARVDLDYDYPPDQPPHSPAASLEKSCEEAAAILAQLRGHTDRTMARMALGCAGTQDCVVRNTDLLQLMGEMA